MNKCTLMLTLLLSGLCMNALAAPTAQLSFKAEAEPPPCHIQSAPSAINFGNIHRDQLVANTATQLPVQSFAGGIAIQCEGATSIGLSAVDNAPGSAITVGELNWSTPSVKITPSQTEQRFGLGMTTSGNPIGVWNVVFHSAQVDGHGVDIGIARNRVLDTNDASPTMRKDGSVITWVKDNAVVVGSIFTVQVDAAVAIAPITDLATGSEIDFAGSATLEVTYL